MRWIQEFEYAADALGPGPLVVFAAFDALVVEVVAQRPAFLDENVAELLDVGDDARALLRADVEDKLQDFQFFGRPDSGRQLRALRHSSLL